MLTAVAQLRPGRVVADVGSGTGILTRLLLQSGAHIFGVEPNAAMRRAAERAFLGEPRFESRNALAEATGLPDASVDLITAAQAFHWFDPESTRAEFARILKPDGRVALVWNQRRDTAMNLDYETLLERFEPDYPSVLTRDRTSEPKVRAFFSPAAASQVTFHNEQYLDKAGLCGLVTSSSYAPAPGSALYEPMMHEVSSIFDTHAREGRVVIEYETVLWYGRFARGDWTS